MSKEPPEQVDAEAETKAKADAEAEFNKLERGLRLQRRLGFGIPATIAGGIGALATLTLLLLGDVAIGFAWMAVIGGSSMSMLAYGLKTLFMGETDDTDSILFTGDGDRQLLDDENAVWKCPDCSHENSNRSTTCEKCSYSLV